MKRRLDGNEEDNCQNKKTKYQTLWHYYENIIRKANFMFAWKKPLHAWDKQMIKFGVPEVKPHHFSLSFVPSPSSCVKPTTTHNAVIVLTVQTTLKLLVLGHIFTF